MHRTTVYRLLIDHRRIIRLTIGHKTARHHRTVPLINGEAIVNTVVLHTMRRGPEDHHSRVI
jgi:hypothetical protein